VLGPYGITIAQFTSILSSINQNCGLLSEQRLPEIVSDRKQYSSKGAPLGAPSSARSADR